MLLVESLCWNASGLTIIDQTLLPNQHVCIPLENIEGVWQAIRRLQIRGAPAIGVCAAFGVVVGLREKAPATVPDAVRVVEETADYLATSRPTAVNLFWALNRMRAKAQELADAGEVERFRSDMEEEAVRIWEEDRSLCRAIGDAGAAVLPETGGVLTHCNTGGLATSAYGTALAVILRAHESGKKLHVYADETRPLLQGARLTVWELQKAGVPATLICDSAAAQVMREGRVQVVVVGADRIAANGDTANKIGTYSVALLAKAHDIPFYVAAPSSTFDLSLPSGDVIPIEQRDAEEVTCGFGTRTAPENIDVYNPAFDVTPAALIAGIITEHGVLRPPYGPAIAKALGSGCSAGATHV